MKSTLVYGQHAARWFVARYPERLLEVWVQKDRDLPPELIESLRPLGTNQQRVDKKTLDAKTEGGVHQGVVLVVKAVAKLNESDLTDIVEQAGDSCLLLALDHIEDPHNLGACLRTANAAGVTAVIIPNRRAAGLTATARKVAAGAADIMPLVEVTNLVRTLQSLQKQNVWVVGTADTAKANLFEHQPAAKQCWVLGNEASGMKRLTTETCDELVSIPMQGVVESLNVSVATALCLFESVRTTKANT